MFVQQPAQGVATKTAAGVIGLQGDDPVVTLGPEFVLQDFDLRLDGAAPELAVEVEAGAVVPGAVLVTGGIAQRIEREFVARGGRRIVSPSPAPSRRSRVRCQI